MSHSLNAWHSKCFIPKLCYLVTGTHIIMFTEWVGCVLWACAIGCAQDTNSGHYAWLTLPQFAFQITKWSRNDLILANLVALTFRNTWTPILLELCKIETETFKLAWIWTIGKICDHVNQISIWFCTIWNVVFSQLAPV